MIVNSTPNTPLSSRACIKMDGSGIACLFIDWTLKFVLYDAIPNETYLPLCEHVVIQTKVYKS